MKTLTTLITILFISLLCSPSWSETVSMDDLVEEDGIFYKKLKSVPFTGDTNKGLQRGSFKNGKKEGLWRFWYENGQLKVQGNYKNGMLL